MDDDARQARERRRRNIAIALVLAALGRQEEADQEHGIAKKLAGREPDETLF